MPNQEAPVARDLVNSNSQGSRESSSVTIFTLPKPFTGDARRIQRNAIGSWAILGQDVEVILIGDESGIAEAANELAVEHLPDVARNTLGTPLINSAFASAASHARSELMVYCNADVIIDRSFIDAVKTVGNHPTVGDSFLAIGRRTDVDVDGLIDWSKTDTLRELFSDLRQRGEHASILCKEYFAFRRSDFAKIPAFSVGRGNWDNWMVASAKQRRIPVVNISRSASVFHQKHDYRHLQRATLSNSETFKGRLHCYVSGDEAQENQRLAGGKHLIAGSTSTWRLTKSGVVKNRLSFLHLEFWMDFWRFAKLVQQLFLKGRF